MKCIYQNINILYLFILTISLFSFSSCKNKISSDFVIPEQWDSSVVLSTDIDIKDTSKLYNIYYQLEIDKSYIFQNLWLFISITDPNKRIVNDTINFNFKFNRENKKFFSSNYKNTFIYASNVKFNKSGNYNFGIKHALRQKSIKHINKIKIIIK